MFEERHYKEAEALRQKQRTEWKMAPQDEKCHDLYTHWAMHHLKELCKCRRKLNQWSNSNLNDVKQALNFEIDKLISTNPAYRDAAAKLFAKKPLQPYT